MFTGLAPSSQTVAFIIDDLGATKGGSYNNAGIAIGAGNMTAMSDFNCLRGNKDAGKPLFFISMRGKTPHRNYDGKKFCSAGVELCLVD